MSLAQNDEFRARVQNWVALIEKTTNYHSLELPDGSVIEGVIPVSALRGRLEDLTVPHDLQGMRVLDVGAASGWNSFELERRGADVVAVDCVALPEFGHMQNILNSKVEYRILDVDEICPERIGTFDMVLFLGVLYHLRHPLLALEKICSVTKDYAFIESFVTDSSDALVDSTTLEFYEIDELGGQIDNWFGPTTNCLVALCRSAGFARVRLAYSRGGRAGVVCHRHWEAAPDPAYSVSPRLMSAVNNRTNQNIFHRGLDEYICIYFKSELTITRQSLLIEVGGFGIGPIMVICRAPGEWQANSRLPPGLEVGQYKVQIRSLDSDFSESYLIEMKDRQEGSTIEPFVPSLELTLSPPDLCSAVNSMDGGIYFRGHRAERLSAYFRTTAGELSKSTVLMKCGEESLVIDVLIELEPGVWQVNARLPKSLPIGSHYVRVRTSGSSFSQAAEIHYKP